VPNRPASWPELLGQERVERRSAERAELMGQRMVAERNLADARLAGLSIEGRFGHALDAARALSTMVIRAEGYRALGEEGGHRSTYLALEAADPAHFARRAAYFEVCRAKRDELGYDTLVRVTEAETGDLLREVEELRAIVDEWLRERHPDLA